MLRWPCLSPPGWVGRLLPHPSGQDKGARARPMPAARCAALFALARLLRRRLMNVGHRRRGLFRRRLLERGLLLGGLRDDRLRRRRRRGLLRDGLRSSLARAPRTPAGLLIA